MPAEESARVASNSSSCEELVLLVIVIIFLVCHLPRIALNVYEFIENSAIKESYQEQRDESKSKKCFRYVNHFGICHIHHVLV